MCICFEQIVIHVLMYPLFNCHNYNLCQNKVQAFYPANMTTIRNKKTKPQSMKPIYTNNPFSSILSSFI
nr:MAG TPA: hypothetical protein [Caudoviricetes sp.]